MRRPAPRRYSRSCRHSPGESGPAGIGYSFGASNNQVLLPGTPSLRQPRVRRLAVAVRHRTGYILPMHSLRAAVLSFTLLGGMPTSGNDRDIPGWMTGHFTDDYGIVHVITDSTWQLGAHDRYWL